MDQDLSRARFSDYLIKISQRPCEVGSIIIPILL